MYRLCYLKKIHKTSGLCNYIRVFYYFNVPDVAEKVAQQEHCGHHLSEKYWVIGGFIQLESQWPIVTWVGCLTFLSTHRCSICPPQDTRHLCQYSNQSRPTCIKHGENKVIWWQYFNNNTVHHFVQFCS